MYLNRPAHLSENPSARDSPKVDLPGQRVIRFGPGGDFVADQVRLTREGLHFRLNGRAAIRVPLFGLNHLEKLFGGDSRL